MDKVAKADSRIPDFPDLPEQARRYKELGPRSVTIHNLSMASCGHATCRQPTRQAVVIHIRRIGEMATLNGTPLGSEFLTANLHVTSVHAFDVSMHALRSYPT